MMLNKTSSGWGLLPATVSTAYVYMHVLELEVLILTIAISM